MNEILNREFVMAVGAGLTLLGFGLIAMDFFMARLVNRLEYPEYKITEQELLVGQCQGRRNAASERCSLGGTRH